MGTLIEHANLLRGTFDEFEGQHRVRLFNGFVNTLGSRLNDCHCVVDGGATIHCGLVIGCDGANSTVRRLAGIGSAGRDYQQQATVCNVETERPHERIARQRFLIDGPLAFLPLPAANSCAVVWTTTTEQTRRLVARDDQDFCETLGAAFDFELGRITGTSARASFPLARAHAEHYVSDGIVLVGDAAHLIHPLAGQGLNLGILDVACLAECLAPRGSGDHAFRRAQLRRFERWRRGENLAMMFATDQINRLFRSNSTVLRRLRGTGMQMTNASGPVKRWIIARAMGDVGDLPAIARPVWDGARS
jgi:2-octaprenylphenol hydroxylase